jgi:hypothetical protein
MEYREVQTSRTVSRGTPSAPRYCGVAKTENPYQLYLPQLEIATGTDEPLCTVSYWLSDH